MTTTKTVCQICEGHGLIERNDTNETCRNCNGTGYIVDELPEAIYPKLQMKIDQAAAAGEQTISVSPDDARLMENAGYVRDEERTRVSRELGHGKTVMLVTKPQPAPVKAEQMTIKIDTSDEAMVGSDGWGIYDAAASVAQFIEDVQVAVQREYPDHTITIEETDYTNRVTVDGEEDVDVKYDIDNIISDVFQSQSWYVESDEKAETIEAQKQLNTVMTAGEAAEEFNLSESTVRQAINREQIIARKSGGTWLILRKHAEERWGKQK